MKADLAIYTHVLGVPEQYKSVALMLSHKWISIVVPIGMVFANPVTYITLIHIHFYPHYDSLIRDSAV